MPSYDILSPAPALKIRATGGTRAGLLTIILTSVFQSWRFEKDDHLDAPVTEQPFSLEGQDFSVLIASLLGFAVERAAAKHEVYDTLSIALITETKLQGKLVGTPLPRNVTLELPTGTPSVSLKKIETGEWEATIAFSDP